MTAMATAGCTGSADARPGGEAAPADKKHIEKQRVTPSLMGATGARAEPESCLGVADIGIFADLDEAIQLALPERPGASWHAVVDDEHDLLVLYADDWPIKVYPVLEPDNGRTTGWISLRAEDRSLVVRPGDARELTAVLPGAFANPGPSPAQSPPVRTLPPGAVAAPGDADGDGIPDPLDVLIGAKKTVANAAAYTEGYVRMSYPNGDVPRTTGVCTDVVVRAVRNAGLDIQEALHRDIARAPRAYPMVKGGGNAHIDHRRVKTLLPYFKRHWDAHTAANDDAEDPLRPGDVVFMDTFPSRSGPDHIGIVSERVGPSGLPLVVNNWTNGTVTAEMDLLGWVPVTHRFRFRSRGQRIRERRGRATASGR